MRITIILVAPAEQKIFGAAARAMKTMGFSELRIVDSQAHLEPATRWVAHGSGDIIDNIKVFPTLVESLHDVDFTVATTARSRASAVLRHASRTGAAVEEKSSWMSHAALVFGREDSGLTNEELALADVLTGVPMVADYPSLNLGQAVMVYCYGLARLIQQPAKSDTTADQHQLQALRERVMALLTTLAVADDIKLVDWLQQRLGLFEQRDRQCCTVCCMILKKISPNKKRLSKYFSAFDSDCNGQYFSVWIKKRVSDSSF
ncbi:tRNA/rRNA methyltransferase [Escherichia coli]